MTCGVPTRGKGDSSGTVKGSGVVSGAGDCVGGLVSTVAVLAVDKERPEIGAEDVAEVLVNESEVDWGLFRNAAGALNSSIAASEGGDTDFTGVFKPVGSVLVADKLAASVAVTTWFREGSIPKQASRFGISNA